MHQHAPSQIGDTEATRLLVASLETPDAEISLLRCRAIGNREWLALRRIETPEGPMFMLRLADVIDDEPTWESQYSDEAEALAVWEHVIDEYDNPHG